MKDNLHSRAVVKTWLKAFSFFVAVTGFAFASSAESSNAERLRRIFDSDDRRYVFAVAHRSAWREAPENSVAAIRAAIELGADMVEIDIAKTKDGVHVLSHDGKLDRVSDRKGKICDLTLAEVKAARLREGQGGKDAKLTDERIPTLAEALEVCRGKILVNIDKFNVDPEGITAAINKLGMARQIVLKSSSGYAKIKKSTGEPWKYVESHDFIFMPVVNIPKDPAKLKSAISAFRNWDKAPYVPPAYEICIPGAAPTELWQAMKESSNHPRIWINTLWDSLAHDHSETTEGHTPDSTWGWAIGQGATLIQTDDPRGLVRYLKSTNHH